MSISPENEQQSPVAPEYTIAQRARLIALLTELYAGARDHYWGVADQVSELIAGYPTMDLIEPDLFRGYLEGIL